MCGLSNEPIPEPTRTPNRGSQIGDHRLSTSCGVVERPDQHCGDDLVLHIHLFVMNKCDNTFKMSIANAVHFDVRLKQRSVSVESCGGVL